MSRHEGTKTRGILFEKRLLRAFVCSWLIVTSGGLAAQEPPAAPRVSRLAILQAEDHRAPTAHDVAVIRSGLHGGDDQTTRIAVRALVERYGVHFDPLLRDEVVARVERLNLPSYTGFVMPRLTAVRDAAGAITDVEISYPLDLATQMLEYSAATRHLRARS